METKRLRLKEIAGSDIAHIHKGLSDPEVTKYYDVHFPTLKATQEQMNWYAGLKKNGTGIWWGIYFRGNDSFCGAAGFNDVDRVHRKAEIGFWLLPGYWGRGIMREVMPALFKAGFGSLDLNRIEAVVQSENLKSVRLLEKAKFRHEGRMREWEIRDGKFIDVDLYATLRKDNQEFRAL